MAEPKVLEARHAWGLKGGVSCPAHHVDEATTLYPCGHSVVVYNSESRDQELIAGLPNTKGISALALAPSRKWLVVAEQGLETAQIAVYDAVLRKRRKVLTYNDLQCDHIVHMAFSHDGKYLLTQGGGQEWTLVLWTFDVGRKKATVKAVGSTRTSDGARSKVSMASFSPRDHGVVCASGDNGILRFLRIQEHQFRAIPFNLKRDPQNYLCHCWLGNRDALVLSGENGDLLYFENYEFRGLLAVPGTQAQACASLVAFSKGFVAGGVEGALRVFEKSEDPREHYTCRRVFTMSESALVHLSVSPSEETLVIASADLALTTFNLANADVANADDAACFDPLSTTFHSSAIIALDVCARKPLIASVAKDHRLKIWDYRSKRCEVSRTFREPPICVALHPSGLYVLVVFPAQVKLLALLEGEASDVASLNATSASFCSFARGGHAFCLVNKAVVTIYDTVSCEPTYSLRAASRVASVVWERGDARLATVGRDGSCATWVLHTEQRDGEAEGSPKAPFYGGAGASDLKRVFCACADESIREFGQKAVGQSSATEFAALASLKCVESVGSLVLDERVLFTGSLDPTRPGFVYAHMLHGDDWATREPLKFPGHASSVSCLALAHDRSQLFSGGSDGSLLIYDCADVDAKGRTSVAPKTRDDDFTEEILVRREELEQGAREAIELGNKVDELVLNNEYQLRLKDMTFKEDLLRAQESYNAELELDARKYDSLNDEKRKTEDAYEVQIKELEDQHRAEFRDLELQYDSKINSEVARYQGLVAARDQENRAWDAQNLALVDGHTQEISELTTQADRRIDEESVLQKTVVAETEALKKQFSSEKVFVEADADAEVDDEKFTYESKLTTEKRQTQKLRDENGLSKKKFAQLTKDVEGQKEAMAALRDRETDLRESIKGLEKDVQGHKKEIRERDETIADKEKRIFDLWKKNQELEKFKFVLDYKIKELKRQIEPREAEIADLRRQVEEMDLELEQYHKSNAALDLMIGELRLKLDGMSKELGQQKALITAGEAYTRRFRRDLAMCAAGLEDQNDLKAGVKELYQRYVLDEDKSSGEGKGFDLQAEYARQREHLERNVAQLKCKVIKDEKMYTSDKARLSSEGLTLVDTMAKLKRDHASFVRKREAVRLEAEAAASDPRLGEIVEGLEDRARILEELMGEAGLLNPPPLPQ